MAMSDTYIDQPEIATAILQLKRQMHRITKYAAKPVIVLAGEALPKIQAAIDPTGDLYQGQSGAGRFICFAGVAIVAAEDFEENLKAARDYLERGC